ncbi:MAG: hypothetical protein M1836_004473 [Candelina mexicana]|nr:MAG: hypothetical protein M1836_004473 [Candelina mexicana]
MDDIYEYFAGSDKCILCDEDFPDIELPKNYNPDVRILQDWPHFFRAILTPKPNSQPVPAGPGIIPRSGKWVDVYIGRPTDPRESRRLVSICRRTSGEPAYWFHTFCWQLLLKNNVRANTENVFRAARSAAPLYILPATSGKYRDDFALSQGLLRLTQQSNAPYYSCVNGGHNRRGLLGTLEKLSRLPPEIILNVWNHLSPCVTKSLISVKSGRMDKLLDRIDSARPGSSGLLSLSDHITVHLVSIRGTRYISGLDNGKQMLGHSSERHERFLVSVPLQVNEIKLTIGLYGIRRIKFCGPSGSSEWVEDDVLTRSEGSTWTGALRSTQIAFMLSWDDLRINGLTNTQEDSERFGDCFLWDHDPPDLAVNELSPNTFHEHDSVLDPSQSIRGFPGWRLMRYLPLVDKGGTLYGLTMFCVRAGGIVGIAAHFRSPHRDWTHMVGFQEGFPIHFRMMEGEHITHVYIHCFGARIFAPFILVGEDQQEQVMLLWTGC